MRILIIEDDKLLRKLLKEVLIRNFFTVDDVGSAKEGEQMALADIYDTIVLDVILPDGDGFSVCKNLRESEVQSPILMISIKGEVERRIKGLELGADDFLPKPFELEEFVSRVKALVRRKEQKRAIVLKYGDIVMDLGSYKVFRRNKELHLTYREFMMLEYFLKKAGFVVTREELIDHVWDQSYDSFSNIVDVFVHSLRKKLTTHGGRNIIETVRGVGYRLI